MESELRILFTTPSYNLFTETSARYAGKLFNLICRPSNILFTEDSVGYNRLQTTNSSFNQTAASKMLGLVFEWCPNPKPRFFWVSEFWYIFRFVFPSGELSIFIYLKESDWIIYLWNRPIVTLERFFWWEEDSIANKIQYWIYVAHWNFCKPSNNLFTGA